MSVLDNKVASDYIPTKTPWCKKSCGQESKKGHAEKMQNQNRQPSLPAVDEIKIFDNDDQAAKHYCCLLTVKL